MASPNARGGAQNLRKPKIESGCRPTPIEMSLVTRANPYERKRARVGMLISKPSLGGSNPTLSSHPLPLSANSSAVDMFG